MTQTRMTGTTLPHQWYALHVRPCHEKRVAAQLEAKEQDVFLPLYNVRRRWADRWKAVAVPLFSNYVFCRFDDTKRSHVLRTSGIIDVVRTAGVPAPVEHDVITAIRAIVDSRLSIEPSQGLVQGQHVRMCGGPLNGLTGRLIEIRKQFRLVVSVELLNRSVLVEVDRDWAVPC